MMPTCSFYLRLRRERTTKCLAILGYIIEEGEICPNPERLRPLIELPVPTDAKSLSQCKGRLCRPITHSGFQNFQTE